MSNLLILANNFDNQAQELGENFDEYSLHSLADIIIDSDTGETPEVMVNGDSIEKWDAVYIDPEPKAFNYTRVLLEVLSIKNITYNIDTSSIFILTKKPYLFKVLADKGNSIPNLASISTEKGMTELQKDIDFPVIAKRYSDLVNAETKIFDEFEDLKKFATQSEHGKDFLIIQEHKEDKELFEILYVDGEIISLKIDGSPYSETEETSYSYHSISDTQKEIVEEAMESIGTSICRLRLRDKEIMDIDTDVRLELFKQESGKNIYGRITDSLKGETQ